MIDYAVVPPKATITIDDPQRHNPLSAEGMLELRDAVVTAAGDDNVRVIVVTGAGDRTFSAGGDLRAGFVDDPIGLHSQRGALADLLRALRGAGKPTIARVNGHALGGGFGVAAMCDIVIVAEGATLGSPEVDVGLWAMMITPAIMRAAGPKTALELMLTGRRIDADEALRLGLASRVVPAERLDAAVDETVAALAAKSAATLMIGRDAFYAAEDMPFDAALDHFQNGLTAVALTDDAAEGVAAFLAKRPPEWTGR
ncbi:MAG: enoyl-CoA hydratase-related protein [Acidimicrobiia bacterium]|nr:enoyl-CoA hydratase-related protein [Acidimicrobiia bacterium]